LVGKEKKEKRKKIYKKKEKKKKENLRYGKGQFFLSTVF